MLTLGLTLVMVWRGVFTTRLIVSPEWPEGHGSSLIFGPGVANSPFTLASVSG